MSKRSKKSYSAKLKFQIVLEALTSDKEDAEVARAYDVHPVSLSKCRFLNSGTEILMIQSKRMRHAFPILC